MNGIHASKASFRAGFAVLWCCISLGIETPATGEPAPQFPIVFTEMADLQALGLSLDWPPPVSVAPTDTAKPVKVPHFKNTCYWYAGPITRYLLSLSVEYIAEFTSKGFTRESLCMAIVSGITFDPESGERLATLIYRDDSVLARHLAVMEPEFLTDEQRSWMFPSAFKNDDELRDVISRLAAGNIDGLTDEQIVALIPDYHSTEELPLRVPDCFANGTPLLDCKWHYDPSTGEKLTKSETEKYRMIGEIADQHIQADIASGRGRRLYPFTDKSEEVYLPMDRTFLRILNEKDDPDDTMLGLEVTEDLFDYALPLAWYAATENSPRGYGYALYAYSDDFGDGGISAASLKRSFDKSFSSSRFSPAKLKGLLR